MAGKGKGQKDNDAITADDFYFTGADGKTYVNYTGHGNSLAAIAGYDAQD